MWLIAKLKGILYVCSFCPPTVGLFTVSPPTILYLGKTNKAGRQGIKDYIPMPSRIFRLPG
jgi:hypothetical protein